MPKGLTAFHRRTAYELHKNAVNDVQRNLPLPEGSPDGYVNHLSDKEVLSFMNLWAILSHETNSYEDMVLSRPFDYNALIMELNAPRIDAEAFEKYKDESHTMFVKWCGHKNKIDQTAEAEATFDFTDWPSIWPELSKFHPYDLLEQHEGKSTDDGYFTHFEDIPLTAPLIRHFVMKMLQYSKKMTFPPRSGQKCNIWRQARKLLLSEHLEYRLQRETFSEKTANLAYSDLPWACLEIRHRYFILLALLRYAVRISSTVHNKIVGSINNEDYGIKSKDNNDITLKEYNPLVPLSETKQSYIWLLTGHNICEYHFIGQDKNNSQLINYIGSNETSETVTELFEDSVKENDAKYDIRSQKYPPKIQRFEELVNYEEKKKVRKARHQRNMERSHSMLLFGGGSSLEESNTIRHSRSGRPLRSTRREPIPPPPLPTRAERAAERAKKIDSKETVPISHVSDDESTQIIRQSSTIENEEDDNDDESNMMAYTPPPPNGLGIDDNKEHQPGQNYEIMTDGSLSDEDDGESTHDPVYSSDVINDDDSVDDDSEFSP